jgi:hypothetical protein
MRFWTWLCILFLGWTLGAGEDGTMVCTYIGYGRDGVYELPLRLDCQVQIEAPSAVIRVVMGNPAGIYLRQEDNRVWLQARVTGTRSPLYLITADGQFYAFNLVDGMGQCVDQFVKKVVIVTCGGRG